MSRFGTCWYWKKMLDKTLSLRTCGQEGQRSSEDKLQIRHRMSQSKLLWHSSGRETDGWDNKKKMRNLEEMMLRQERKGRQRVESMEADLNKRILELEKK